MVKRILTFLTLLAVATCQHRKPIVGCLRWNKEAGSCQACYRRQKIGNGCGPLLPPNDPCLAHSEIAGNTLECALCAPGYAITRNGNCVQGRIFDCQIEYESPSGGSTCAACGSGLYPSTPSQCTPQSTQPIAHCLWGASLPGKARPACRRCVPGYVVSATTTACVPWNAGTTGCFQLGPDGSCVTCDALAGYSMQRNGACMFVQQ